MATKAKKDYSKGKIYKIEPLCDHDEGDIYIGSTTKKYLSQRLQQHKSSYKAFLDNKTNNVSIYGLFNKYGIDNFNIFLLENYNCNDINELRQRERFYIQALDCVNKNIPARTKQDYYIDNQDKIKDTSTKRFERFKNENFECKCGAVVRYLGKSRHLKRYCKLIIED